MGIRDYLEAKEAPYVRTTEYGRWTRCLVLKRADEALIDEQRQANKVDNKDNNLQNVEYGEKQAPSKAERKAAQKAAGKQAKEAKKES